MASEEQEVYGGITINTARGRRSLEVPTETSPHSDSAPTASWPRTWAASSDWSARVGTRSLMEGLRRSAYAAGPVVDAQEEEAAAAVTPHESPFAIGVRHAGSCGSVASGTSPSPLAPGGSSGAGYLVSGGSSGAGGRTRLRYASGAYNGDLEEALLYDFDETLEHEHGHEDEVASPKGHLESPEDGQVEDGQTAAAEKQHHWQHHRQQQEQQQQHWHRHEAGPAAGGGGLVFSFSEPKGTASSELDWESTPFLAAASLTKHEHSYLLTRRESGAPQTPPCGLTVPAPPAAGEVTFREPFIVHVEQEAPTSSTLQTAFNAVNLLCGVGLLTTPFALDKSGWGALLLLTLIGAMACTTGSMLARCMARDKSIRSYPDIGGAAFGTGGRILVSCLLYLELFCCCVDFVILEGDGLSALFPGLTLSFGGVAFTAKQSMMFVACGILLPTVLMRDLSILSYLSVFGIFASVLLIALVGSTASVTGFPNAAHVPAIIWGGLPTSAALFSFCFSGHAVFPSLYASLRCKRNFTYVLFGSFALVMVMYGSIAIMGACMFEGVSDNVVLDVQRAAPRAVQTHVAMWTVIINPLTKVALTLTPVAMALEELMPFRANTRSFNLASAGLRTALLASVLLVALGCPFFGIVMSLIGSIFSMSISIVLPCVFFYRLCAPGAAGAAACVVIAAFGAVVGVWSTADAVQSLLEKY